MKKKLQKIEIQRGWGMISKNTFNCPPISQFVKKYLKDSKISIDPFARNVDWCTYTNDLNPNTNAQYHMTAFDFLKMLNEKNIKPDLVIFDPPYSLAQYKRSYRSIGIEKLSLRETKNGIGWYREKDILSKMILPDGYFLHLGWHSNGMGLKRGFNIEEIILVAHGRAIYDTICMAERRIYQQLNLVHN